MTRASKTGAAFIFVLCLYLAFSHLNWLAVDNTPQRWDESIHLSAASGFKETIQKTPLSVFKAFLSQETYYPPLVPFLASFFGLKTPSPDNFTAIMALFLCGGAVFTFLYARFYTGTLQSMAAAAVFAAYPLIIRESHFFMFNLPLTFFFITSLYLLEKSESFTNRKYSALFGLACGMGMLVKWTLFVYIAAPLAIALSMPHAGISRRRGFILAAAVFIIIAAPWYLYNGVAITLNLIKNVLQRRAVEGLPPVFSIDSLLIYFKLFPDIITWPLLLLLFAGTAAAARFREGRRLILIVSAGLALLILIPNKKDRYLMPLLPVFSVISVYAGGLFRGKKPGVIIAALACIFAALSFTFSVYNMPFPWQGSARPERADWHINDFLSKAAPGSTMAVVPDYMYMNNCNYSETARNFFPGVQITGIFNFPMFTDYFLVKTGDLGPSFSGLQKRAEILREALDPKSAVSGLYNKIYEAPLPDGSTGMLFKRKGPARGGKEEYLRGINESIISILPLYARNLEKFSFRADMNAGGGVIEVSFKKGCVGDFKHKNAGLVVRDASIAVDGLITGESGGILSLGEVRVNSLTVSEGDLADFIKIYAGKFKLTSVKLDRGVISIKGEYSKINVEADFTLENPNPGRQGSDIFFRLLRLKAGFIPVPAGLVNFALKDYNPLLNKSKTPVKIVFGSIHAENGELSIK